MLMGEPAGDFGLQLLRQVRTHIEVGSSGAAAEPLEHASDGEIGVDGLHIKRHVAQRLEGVHHNQSAHAVRLVDDGLHVLDVRAAEDHVRNGNQQRLFINGVKHAFGGYVNAVIGLDHVDASAARALRFPEVHDGGEVHVTVDHFVPLAAEVKTTGNDGLATGDVQMHAYR